MPTVRTKLLEMLADRLVELLKEADDPLAEMKDAARRLFEADLSDFQPDAKTTPQEFAATVIEDNPALRSLVPHLRRPERPELIESVGELISLLLPAEFDRA